MGVEVEGFGDHDVDVAVREFAGGFRGNTDRAKVEF